MSLKNRVSKLENRLKPKNENMHVIVGPEDTLDEQVEEFRQKNPDFEGLLVVVTDLFKPENSGLSA
jgi:hypothetical protein